MSRKALAPLLLAALAAYPIVGCSAGAAPDETVENEGALRDDALMSSVLGEVSRGATLPANFASRPANEKAQTAWGMASAPGELRCHLGGAVSGDALVSALRACAVGSGSDELREATLGGTLARATYQGFMAALGASGMLSAAFDTSGDELPRLRKKLLHPFGSVARVELRVAETSSFTGVLRAGARVPGIARLSTGGPENVMGFVPGLGLKLFTSGGPSVDLHALHELSGQKMADGKTDDKNYFRHGFSNEIIMGDASGAAAIVNKIFSKTHDPANHLPIDHVGQRAVDGTVEASPVSPKDVVFEPPAELTTAFQTFLDQNPSVDLRVGLAAVTKDASPENPVVLYKVRVGTAEALDKVSRETVDRDLPVIATLVATSAFLPSKWGDGQLYIRHNRGCKPNEMGSKTAVAPSLCSR